MATKKTANEQGKKMLEQNKGYNSLYRNAISQGYSPAEAESMAQMTYAGTSTSTPNQNEADWLGNFKRTKPVVSPGSAVASTEGDFGQSDFDKTFGEYVKASQGAYDIDTQRNLQKYQNNEADLQRTEQRNAEDYARFTGREQSDLNRTLGLQDKDFALKLSQAANAYGQRGLLSGGIMKKDAGVNLEWQQEQQAYLKTASQRRLEDAALQSQRGTEDYKKQIQRLGTEKSNYTTDRATGSEILGMDLQQKGDTIYNTTQANNYALQQEKARQAALDRQYGVTTSPRRAPYRSQGKYII